MDSTLHSRLPPELEKLIEDQFEKLRLEIAEKFKEARIRLLDQ